MEPAIPIFIHPKLKVPLSDVKQKGGKIGFAWNQSPHKRTSNLAFDVCR